MRARRCDRRNSISASVNTDMTAPWGSAGRTRCGDGSEAVGCARRAGTAGPPVGVRASARPRGACDVAVGDVGTTGGRGAPRPDGVAGGDPAAAGAVRAGPRQPRHGLARRRCSCPTCGWVATRPVATRSRPGSPRPCGRCAPRSTSWPTTSSTSTTPTTPTGSCTATTSSSGRTGASGSRGSCSTGTATCASTASGASPVAGSTAGTSPTPSPGRRPGGRQRRHRRPVDRAAARLVPDVGAVLGVTLSRRAGR